MGQSHNRAELIGKVGRAGAALTGPQILQAATDSVKRTLEVSAARSGLRRGSNIAGRPWRGVYVRRAGKGMAVGYAKPAHLVNSPTRPHVIGAKGLGTRATIAKKVTAASVASIFGGTGSASFRGRKGARALHWGGDNFAAYVRSRGTRGKRFFEAAKPAAARDGARSAHRSMVTGLASVFK